MTLETVANVSGAVLPSGKRRGVSDLYQVTQKPGGMPEIGSASPTRQSMVHVVHLEDMEARSLI